MRRDTKIAIGVAALLIVLGTSYLVWGNRGSGSADKSTNTAQSGNTGGTTTADKDKNGKPVQTGTTNAHKPSTSGTPTLARRPDGASPVGLRSGGSEASSSPLSPTVRDTTPTTPRPRPVETPTPGSPLTGTSGVSPTGVASSGLTGTSGTGLTGTHGTATPGSASNTLTGTGLSGSSTTDTTKPPVGSGLTTSPLSGTSTATPGPMPRTNTVTTPSVGVLPTAPGLSSPTTRPSFTTTPPRVGTIDALATKTTDKPLTPSLTGTTATGTTGSTAKPTLATTGKTTHVIQSGDTYSSLAVKYLGHAKYANLIAKANPNVDPRRLKLGAKLNIPAAPESAATTGSSTEPKNAAQSATDTTAKSATTAKPLTATTAKKTVDPVPADRSYKVTAKDSWSSLAKQVFGDSSRWIELYELNKERLPRNRSFALPVGTVIELPAGAKITKTTDDKATTKP